jgi:hypothetical protein
MELHRADRPAIGAREPPAVAGDVAKATAASIGNRRVGQLLRAGHGAALQRALMGTGAAPPIGRRLLSRFELLEEAPTGRAAPGEAPVKLLRKGSAGPLVEELQGDLNAIAVEPALVMDGQFGAQTDVAVVFFQQAHRLVVDGIVGRETRSMLDRELALHGGAEARLARGGGPCHTPDAPGPDELADAPPAPPAPSGRPSGLLGFGPDADAGGGGQSAPPPGQKAAAGDLVVRLSDGQLEKDLAEAAAAPGTTSELVKSRQELIDLVRRRGRVGKLIIISHGTSSGAVKFANENDPTKLADLAKDLQGAGTASEVAFRGCNVGNDASGLNEVKKAVNASSAEGTNCFLQVAHAGPITINGVAIDTEAKFKAIKSNKKGQPDNVLKADYHARLRKATRGHGDCIVELKPNQTMAGLTDDELRALAMRHAGRLILQYYEDHDTGKFTCWKDLQFGGGGPCRRVQAR